MRDAPLVSARAGGIPKSTNFSPPVPELIPLSEALPMMGIALCCVWAAYTTSELPQVMAPAAASPEVAAHAAEPPEAAVLASAPCMVLAPSNVLSACHVTVKGTVDEHCTCPDTELYLFPDVTTVEPPEVAASVAEPPEVSVVPSYESLSCPVTAMEAVYESLSCPVTAMEAVCESLSCPALSWLWWPSVNPRSALSRLWKPSMNPCPALLLLQRPLMNLPLLMSRPMNYCPVLTQPKRLTLNYQSRQSQLRRLCVNFMTVVLHL